ncbi:MAG: hypothetical protein FIA99_18060 [Ruminiclostridium sp.]|nr:hypothetical protein [Ruminiclostridium sp.]
MLNLTHENFIKARDYIFAHSDDINRAWFRYNFEDNDAAAFMNVLAQYQHENSGFGGLMYEWEYNGPTLKDTEHAFRYVFYLKDKPSADHPVIQKMMKYLLDRYRPDIGHWGSVEEPGVNDGAHVPWWGYNENEYPPIADEDARILKYSPNGQAALAAFVALYSELVPEDVYRDIIKYPVEKILRYYDEASPMYGTSSTDGAITGDIATPYNLKCLQQFVKCLKDKPLAEKLAAILCQHPTACMQLDFAKWEQGYEELPCDVVQTPDSVVYPAVKDLVDDSLSYLIRQQKDDGGWHWSFRFGEADVFRKLEADSDAHLTMLILAELGRFGRIENA